MSKYKVLVLNIFFISNLFAANDIQTYCIEFDNSSLIIKSKVRAKITMLSDTLNVREYGAWHEDEGCFCLSCHVHYNLYYSS